MNRYAATPAQIDTRRAEIAAELAKLQAEMNLLNAEYTRRGGWTRAFAVPGGHVHTSMSCTTCYDSTQYGWLPQVSGLDEAEIVELAGERACTVCYPSAPVETRNRPTRLHTADEAAELAAKAERAAELDAKKAAAKAKEITPVQGDYTVIKTEAAARNAILAGMQDLLWYGTEHPSAAEWLRIIDECVEALAAKQGRDAVELRAEFQDKAEKKHAKIQRQYT